MCAAYRYCVHTPFESLPDARRYVPEYGPGRVATKANSRLERLERYAAEREAIIAALTTELHREPTAKERLMIEAAASSIVEAPRCVDAGGRPGCRIATP